jgi:type IV pilus assembly protein PilW
MMNHSMSCASQNRQSGFTIVELMVAIVIALLLTLVIGQVFLGNRKTFATQDQASRVQENGRYAAEVLNRTIREAGYQYWGRVPIPNRFFASAPVSLTMTTSNPKPVSGGNATSAFDSKSDEITVSFYGSSATAGGVADGGILDCTGRSIRDLQLSVNKFFIRGRTADLTEPALWCGASASAVAPATAVLTYQEVELAAGIESMQILYGMADKLEDPQNVGFLRAGGTGFDGDKVMSVRVSLIVRGDNRTTTQADSRDYQHFGPAYASNESADAGSKFTAPGDYRLRRQFSQVIALRNRTK